MLVDLNPIKTEAIYRALDLYCSTKHGCNTLCEDCRRVESIMIPLIRKCPKRNLWSLCNAGHTTCFNDETRAIVRPFLDFLNHEFDNHDRKDFIRLHGTDSRETMEKRSDPRFVKLHDRLKESFLELLMEKEFKEISVAELCRKADIERKTFYNHCSDLMELVNDCVYDFTVETDFMPSQVSFSRWRDNPYGKPMCAVIRENKKYQRLLYDPDLMERCLTDIIAFSLPWTTHMVMGATDADRSQLQSVISFSISGCFMMTRMYLDQDEEAWTRVKSSIDKYNNGGLRIITIT